MVERYAQLAPDHLAKDGNRLDALLGDYDLATSEQQGTQELRTKPFETGWARLDSNQRPKDYESSALTN
jgi:hypothetical protein